MSLELWNKVSKTDPAYTKKIVIGARKFTAIDAQYQLKKATELWGMYGETWGVKNLQFKPIQLGEETLLTLFAEFWYPKGSFEIAASVLLAKHGIDYKTKQATLKIDDDAYKKVLTDLTTKALSKLGFNADVFLGQFDDQKYVAEVSKEFDEAKKLIPNFAETSKDKQVAEGVLLAKFIESLSKCATDKEVRARYIFEKTRDAAIEKNSKYADACKVRIEQINKNESK